MREKNPEPGSNEHFSWGACAMQGWRSSMEDSHICKKVEMPNKEDYGMLFGVFDGHGGKEVAEYARDNFKKKFVKTKAFKESNFERALVDTMLELDKDLKSKDFALEAGATACVVFVTSSLILCANSGDSRAVLCSKNQAIPLSEDHKPTLDKERKRIEQAGHFVNEERVDGELALSRALGDH